MLTSSVENMLVTSIDTTSETVVVLTQYVVIISTVRRQSEAGIQRWMDVGPIINFCLGAAMSGVACVTQVIFRSKQSGPSELFQSWERVKANATKWWCHLFFLPYLTTPSCLHRYSFDPSHHTIAKLISASSLS